MPYPPSSLPSSYADATPTPSAHPDAHNDANEAINDTVEILGQAPQGTYADVEGRQAGIEQGASDLFDRKIFGWRRRLTGRDADICTILAIGDSRVESGGVANIADRWLNILDVGLAADFPTVGAGVQTVGGYIPANYASGTLVDPPSSGNVLPDASSGLGLRAMVLGPSTGSGDGQVTFDLGGADHVTLAHATIINSGKSEYQIDGGAWTEIDHDNGSTSYFVEQVDVIDLGAPADTLVWRYKSSGAGALPRIHGTLAVLGDPTIGSRVLDCARAGSDPAIFVGKPTQPEQWVTAWGANLAVIDLVSNSWQMSDHATITADVAAYQTDLSDFIGLLRDGNADLEVILLAGLCPLGTLGTGDTQDWPLFIAAQYAIADADPLTSVWDIARAVPAPDSPGDDGTFYDTPLAIHYLEPAQAAIGSALTEHLGLPATGAWGDGSAAFQLLYDAVAAPSFTIVAGSVPALSDVNWTTLTQSNTRHLANYYTTTTSAQNNEIVFPLPQYLQAGTWSLRLLHTTGVNVGIYTIATSPDNSAWTDITTIDGYSNPSVDAVGTDVTGLTIGAGVRYIRFKMATKNASSSAYSGLISSLGGVRTA